MIDDMLDAPFDVELAQIKSLSRAAAAQTMPANPMPWSCLVCTFVNRTPLAVACEMCGHIRE